MLFTCAVVSVFAFVCLEMLSNIERVSEKIERIADHIEWMVQKKTPYLED